MPGTRSSGAGKTPAGVAADGSGGNLPAVQPGDESAERELTSQQENMENSTLKDLMDAEILRLRATVTVSRKLLDDINSELTEQVEIVTAVRGMRDPRLFWFSILECWKIYLIREINF